MTGRAPSPPPVGDAAIDNTADDYLPTFAPVPGRARRDGWTPDRQRGFVAALRKCGLVAAAARSVGMSEVTAYRLRNRPGAEEFAAAWDRALAEARSEAFARAMECGVHGYAVPRFYRGHFTGTLHRYDDRMTIAALRYASRPAPPKG